MTSPNTRRKAAQLQCIFLCGGVAHVSKTATIHELLHSSLMRGEVSLQQRIINAANNFTDKHKQVMNTLRKETKSVEENFDEAYHILETPTRPQTTSSAVVEKHAKKFNAIESQVLLTKSTSTSSFGSSNLTYDYMSGVWRMLKSERDSHDFIVSPKGFEFDAAKTKWVPKSDAVVKQIQESKEKCEDWLTKKCGATTATPPGPLGPPGPPAKKLGHVSRGKANKLKPLPLPKIVKNRNKLT